MKKWLFSNDGKITDPLNFNEAKNYISNNLEADLYVWHPSFTHWKPLINVDEFSIEVKIPSPPVALPKELLEEYKNQEEALFKTLSRIDNTLGNTRSGLSELGNEIDTYFNFTEKLNGEVEQTLKNIRKQYAALQSNIDEFKKEEFVF